MERGKMELEVRTEKALCRIWDGCCLEESAGLLSNTEVKLIQLWQNAAKKEKSFYKEVVLVADAEKV